MLEVKPCTINRGGVVELYNTRNGRLTDTVAEHLKIQQLPASCVV